MIVCGVMVLSGVLFSRPLSAEEQGILFHDEPAPADSAAVPALAVKPKSAVPVPPASPRLHSSLTAAVMAVDDPALTLADVAGGKAQFLTLSQQVLNQLVRQQPELARHEKIVLAWGREALTWDKMRVELASIYHQYFTPAEILDMTVFFRSSAGQKWLRYSPLLKEQTIAIGQKLAKADQPRLLLMLQQANQH